ncbi:MAG: helix-turn-helix domain-containing protein [Oscillospiraceae bacterium]|jgi:excisionase family DNA binding protein|nr:helix-turn-helix domain-containing protein [Oscillospiraceae bacterium]
MSNERTTNVNTGTNNDLPEKWVNLEDIAVYLSVSEDTVRTWIRTGKIPVSRAGKRYKFKISEIDEWVRSGGERG